MSRTAVQSRVFSPVTSSVMAIQSVMSFTQSLKPMLVWLDVVLGIDLDASRKKPTWRLFLSTFYCVFWLFFFNVPLNTYYVINGRMADAKLMDDSATLRANLKIFRVAGGVLGILFHASLLVSALRKWKGFRSRLKQLEHSIGDRTAFYRQLRRNAIQGLVIIFMVESSIV